MLGYSSPGIILPLVATGIFGSKHIITESHTITFFSITASVCFVGLLAFYVLYVGTSGLYNVADSTPGLSLT